MDQGREGLRSSRDAYRTEQTSGHGIRRDRHSCGGKTQPNRLGTQEVERLLAHLATEGQVSASTQRQALNALVVLYRDVLHTPLESTIAPLRSKRRPRPPTVLTQADVQRRLAAMTGRHALRARLLSGGGLRLLECLRLRIQDVDFGQTRSVVRGGKGGQDRTTLLPRTLRHRFATQRLEHGVNIRGLQARLGHAEVKTTELDTQVMARDIRP
jgi:site-specific recombinase XerD